MTNEDLITALKKIVKPYVQDELAFETLGEESDFIHDLKINSAHLIDVVLDIEDHFDITIENEELEKMVSVGSAMKLISTKIS
ncbi:phosphopantetheine-binding protein [Flavobacteriaceae bacterium F08102]|nr:phosphopantetheine-binding protein [Flavobacteriaceae bacterium F08102]